MAPNDLDRIARTYGIRLLLLFGSSVTGHLHPQSDVDVAVLLDRPELTPEARARLVPDLPQCFPDREVDLAVLNRADTLFLKQVADNCRLLSGAPRSASSSTPSSATRIIARTSSWNAASSPGRSLAGTLMVDRDLVTRKMAMILDDLRAATAIAQKPVDAYLASTTDELVGERYLERMIGRMIDINDHLFTEAGHAPPRDYDESFTQLAKLGLLAPAFASQIAACAGLRNRLVHEYDEIDPRRVYEGLQAAVRDIPDHLTRVHAYLAGAS